MKLLSRILKRNHQLYIENKLQKRLNLCLIRDNDNAFQRNKKAVKYIDNAIKNLEDFPFSKENQYRIEELQDIREILTCFQAKNVLDEVNKKDTVLK